MNALDSNSAAIANHCGFCNTGILSKAGNDDNLECINCGICYDHERLAVANDDGSYWCEIPKESMAALLHEARSGGWRTALELWLSKDLSDQRHLLFGENRADWLIHATANPVQCLDVGGGFGQVAWLLSQDAKRQVISLEKTRERAQFQTIRRNQEKRDNLTIVNGDFFDTPFQCESFDIISFIGVFEWLGTSSNEIDPDVLQQTALEKSFDALKPGGCLCLGIENRVSFKYLLGARDHTGLRFTSIMPRKLADLWVSFRTPEFNSNTAYKYRTLTYSPAGYKRLLEVSGFEKVEIRLAFPNYTNPKCILEPSNSIIARFMSDIYQASSSRDAVFARIFKGLARIGLGVITAPYLYVYGYKPEQ
ncbi:MAG: class I SAM-dependent methyltransferase [Granulosicoccus sp.]